MLWPSISTPGRIQAPKDPKPSPARRGAGSVTRGPAFRPLPRLREAVAAGGRRISKTQPRPPQLGPARRGRALRGQGDPGRGARPRPTPAGGTGPPLPCPALPPPGPGPAPPRGCHSATGPGRRLRRAEAPAAPPAAAARPYLRRSCSLGRCGAGT